MSNFNICKSTIVLIIVIVATSLTEVITLRQAEVLVNESAFISCFSEEVKHIQWHHTPHGKKSYEYVYAGGRFYSPYNKGRFRVDNNLTTHVYTLIITNVMSEDAGLYECKDDVLSGVFGSTHLTVLDSGPVCTSNVNPNSFVGPNTCNIEQENMIFSCAVSFSGNSPNLMWSTLYSNQSLNLPVCERKDNRINCSLSMEADPSFDGSTFICQTTSNDARHNCSIKNIRVKYFFRDYAVAEKRVGDNVTCMVASNLQSHYNWTIQKTNDGHIFSSNRTIYLQKPGFYKCSVKYNIRDVTCYAPVIAVYVSNIVDVNASREQSNGLAIGLSIGLSMCLVAVIAFLIDKKYDKGRRVLYQRHPDEAETTNQTSGSLPLVAITTPESTSGHMPRSKQTFEYAGGISAYPMYSDGPRYALKNRPRGYCIIINNFEFPWLKPRSGAVTEIVALKKLFEGLKFKVKVKTNLTTEQMIDCLIEYRDRDHSASDAFVCCLLSHGEKGRFDATDGQIPILKIMELFYDRNCPGLAGKPKLFFIGTCQGEGVYVQSNPPDSDGQLLPERHDMQYEATANIVKELAQPGAGATDFIVSYACLPEATAWHDSRDGGLYVQALCRHLNRDLEIDIALRYVNQEVRDLLNTYDKEGKIYSRQDPFHIIMPPQKFLFLGSA